MSDLDFLDKISAKIQETSSARQAKLSDLMDGSWHVTQVRGAIDAAMRQIAELDEDQRLPSLVGIIEQMPDFVESLWKNTIKDVEEIDKETARWEEMKVMYSQFIQEKEAAAVYKEELAEALASGKIDEPSTRTGMRRQTGQRPPVTLRDFRNLSPTDEEQKTSSPDGS